MINILMFLMGMLCTNPTPHAPGTKCNGFHVITTNADTGGETGNPPPPPPPPPPKG